MNLKSLTCPNCGANLEVENGLDTFFCKYCGFKILLDDLSEVAYEAKVKVKQMEHQERLQKNRHAQERYKLEAEQKNDRHAVAIGLGIFGVIFVILFVILVIGNTGVKRQERKLQAIVDEIIIDIENENFTEAYVKANSLYWDDSWTSEGEDKWKATRKEILDQIEEAEKKATKSTKDSTSEDKNRSGFWDLFS